MTQETGGSQDSFADLDRYITDNLSRFITELGTFCAGGGPGSLFQEQVNSPEETARFLTELFKERGLKVENWSAGGNYALFARTDLRAGQPTLLSYNSYRLPKIRKEDEWSTALFGLNGREGHLYARNVADNRANLVARLAALEAWREVRGSVPANVKFLVEGLTEFSQPQAPALLENKAATLAAEACLWDSGDTTNEGLPVISLGQKGLLVVELTSRTLERTADSSLAGILPSGGWRLIWALSAIKNDNEDIQIDGFEDDIFVPTTEDSHFILGAAKQFKDRQETRLKEYGQPEYLMGLSGVPLLITEFFTPTANVIAVGAGWGGPEPRPSLLASAKAQIEFRLVPEQTPDKVFKLLEKHLKKRGFADIEVRQIGRSEPPSRTSPNHPFVKLVQECATAANGGQPLLLPLGPTTGPMSAFKQHLGDLPVIGIGTSYSGSQQGTPDENIREADFLNHIKFMARLLGKMAGD